MENLKYKEISCEIAMNQLKRRIPYSWDLNIYRGCEPGGVESDRRFKMLKTFRKTNASVGLHVMPIIPYKAQMIL